MNSEASEGDTVTVKVVYLGLIGKIVGSRAESVDLRGGQATLRGLVAHLVNKYGPELGNWMMTSTGDLDPRVILLVDGRSVSGVQPLDIRLSSDSEVQVVVAPRVVGGRARA